MRNKKILVICASGIGNTILFTPTLKILRESLPKAKITLLVTKPVFAEPIRGSDLIDEIITLDGGFWQKLKIIINLRKEEFDCSITGFPSNRWQFNLFAFLVGAKTRITHSYKVGRWRTLSFLQNIKIPANENLHDVDQNLNLLRPLNIKSPKEKKLLFFLPEKEKRWAKKFWRENNLNSSFTVGIHPGSGGIQQEAKRWPEDKFAKLCDRLIEKKKAKILIFGGPEEKELKERTRDLSQHEENIHLVDAPLKQTAALIERCNSFISNDSGLMQVAVTVGAPKVIAIFGPTNYKRTTPYGKNCFVIRKNLPCSPCLKYPFYSTSSKIKCNKNFECLRKTGVEHIVSKINGFLR